MKRIPQNLTRGIQFIQQGKRLTIVGGVLVALALLLNPQTVAALFGFSADLLDNSTVGKTWIIRGDALIIGLTLALIPFRSNKFGRRVSTVFIGLTIMLGIILLIEGAFLVIGAVSTITHRTDPNFLAPYRYRHSLTDGTPLSTIQKPDQALGRRLLPNLDRVLSERLGVEGNVLFTMTVSTDANGHRITPVTNPDARDKFILFFSDSFIFGAGVNDDETLPARVGALAPAYMPYNYGVPGYGPQQMLIELQGNDIRSEVRQQSGALIYLFINDHIKRAIGAMNHYNSSARTYPYYRLDSNDQLAQFSRVDPLQEMLYGILGNSLVLKTFNVDLPPIGDQELRVTARIIQAARDEFKRKFNSEEFYVLLYPGRKSALIPYLEQAGIKYLDYAKLFPFTPAYRLFQDGHPSPLAYQTLAEQIVKDLQIR